MKVKLQDPKVTKVGEIQDYVVVTLAKFPHGPGGSSVQAIVAWDDKTISAHSLASLVQVSERTVGIHSME